MKNKELIIGVLVGISLVFIFSTFVVEKRLSDARALLVGAVLEQNTLVISLAKDIGAGKAVEFVRTENIITDCGIKESQEYDELLSALDSGLSSVQLLDLKNLFNQCGSIPAVSRAFMVYILEREIESLYTLMSQQELLGSEALDESTIPAWRNLLVKEKEIQAQFYALVALQGKIIDTLQSGAAADIVTVQDEVRVVQQKYSTAIAEASEIRTVLVSP